jgi:PAS domain S-box-containing protein
MFTTLCGRHWLAVFPPPIQITSVRLIEERSVKVLLSSTASTVLSKWTKARPEGDATFELLFKNNPLPLWVYDLETLHFLDINEVACRKYGWSREEFLALTMRDIRPPEDIPRMHASVRAHPSEVFNSSIWRHRKKDGATIYVESISHEIVYKGRRARFVCPIDITDRLKAETAKAKLAVALQEREAGLRHAQRMAKLAHVITRPDGSFESWSETLPELVGVDASRCRKAPASGWTFFILPTAQRFVPKRWKRARQERAPMSNIAFVAPMTHGFRFARQSSRSRDTPTPKAECDGSAHCKTSLSRSVQRPTSGTSIAFTQC